MSDRVLYLVTGGSAPGLIIVFVTCAVVLTSSVKVRPGKNDYEERHRLYFLSCFMV